MLLLPSFKEAKIIAGRSGMENEITGAMILEGADIESWGKHGQLIITSFFALQNLSQRDIVHFFRTMCSIGIGALAFKPGRLLNELPSQVIDLCEDFDLPLIRLSPTVKYESILLDVLGHVIDSNITLLNRFYEAHRHVMTLALKQPSIPYILGTLKNSLHADITYLDSERDRRLSTDASLTGFTGFSLTRRDPSAYQTQAYYDARLLFGSDDASAPTMSATRDETALAVRIPSSDGDDYFLIIHNDGSDLTPLDTMLVENIVSLLQMEILKQNAIKQKLFYQNNNTVHDLLLDRFPSHERIDGALTLLGIDHYPLYEVLLIRATLVDPVDNDRQDELHQAIRRRLRTLYPGVVYYVNGDRLVFLHNLRSELSGIDVNAVQDMLENLHDSSTLPLFRHLAVLSNQVDRYSLSVINNEVMSVYRLFDASSRNNESIRYRDLGIYKLLLSTKDVSQLEEFVDPRVRRLYSEQPEMFNTLVSLCEHGFSHTQAADELFVHPKTVRYRVERAKTAYGIDIKQPDSYLQVLLASKIYKLKITNE